VNVVNETRNKTYERLAKIAGSVGVDEQKILALLVIPETPESPDALNVGNQVTNDIKWMTKVGAAHPPPQPGDSLTPHRQIEFSEFMSRQPFSSM
jgi:hypothetical protein